MEECGKTRSRFLRKNQHFFRQINVFTKEAQCGKTWNFLSLKKFRQINYIVISLVKPLLLRHFCYHGVRENFCNFHTVINYKRVDFTENEMWINEKFTALCHAKIFTSNQFSYFLVKSYILSRKEREIRCCYTYAYVARYAFKSIFVKSI